mmetsp:Transcript_104070/g.269445  ORF Transcript_104070/g.269445 Transcript_104070/m.269445 type:complete len:81 (-) Transcript_104070:179-421(-)
MLAPLMPLSWLGGRSSPSPPPARRGSNVGAEALLAGVCAVSEPVRESIDDLKFPVPGSVVQYIDPAAMPSAAEAIPKFWT